MKRFLAFLVLCTFYQLVEPTAGQPAPLRKEADANSGKTIENLNVLHQWIRWNHGGSLIMHHLLDQAELLYERRKEEISRLKTRSDWEKRRDQVKSKLLQLMGPFPEKTALQARITGTIVKKGYRVEKILYQSMPDLYVSGCLFLPEGIREKVPAIVNFIGHNQNSFRAELYQRILLNLVKKGMIVLAIDPPGQGERVQYYDPKKGLSSIGYSVIEHCYVGNQCFLSGSSAARYFTWDGIRAIDYLLTRKEVDPARIGVTGFSGGGTVTAYVSAVDERVNVSVPCSWATASRRQLETKGAQDAETEMIRSLAEGITFEDLLEVRAPKPTLMTLTSRDQYLSLQGAREALREARMAFEVLGHGDHIQLAEDDAEHAVTPKLRQALYAFFLKHFALPGDPAEEDIELLSDPELQVTATGQVSTSSGSKAIFDLNREETQKWMEMLAASRNNVENHLAVVRKKAIAISGFQAPTAYEAEPFLNGGYARDGYRLEKIAIRGEGSYVIPMLLFLPHRPSEKSAAIVYIHSEGKATDALPGGDIEKLVKKGYTVAAPDLPGFGEIKDTSARGLAIGYTGVLLGRSIPGIQAGDILRVVRFLATRPEVDPKRIFAVGKKGGCIPLIHAAALDTSIRNILLLDPLVSFRCVAENRYYKIGVTEYGGGSGHPYEIDFNWGIGEVLTGYDLPDLLGCMAPRKVLLANIQNQMLETASEELVRKEMEFPLSVYSLQGVSGNLRIVPSGSPIESLADWCFL